MNGVWLSAGGSRQSSPLFSGQQLRGLVRTAAPALLFGLRLWASVCLALYVAFWLELDSPYWAGTTAALVCQPHLGAFLAGLVCGARRALEGPETAPLAHCLMGQRRSIDQTDNGRSARAAGTSLPAPFRSFPRSAFEQCASAQPTMLTTSGPGNAAMSVELATNANHKVGSIIRYPSSGTSRRGDLPDAAAITRVTHRPSSGLSPRQRRAARSGSTGSATPSSVRSRNPSASWSTISTTTTASRTTTRPSCATAPSCDHPTSTR